MFKAEVSINMEYGAVKLQLPDEYVQRLLPVVADLLIEAAQNVAANLTKQALDHKALEHKAGDVK